MANPHIPKGRIEAVPRRHSVSEEVLERNSEIGFMRRFANSRILAIAFGAVGVGAFVLAYSPFGNDKEIKNLSPRKLEANLNKGKARVALVAEAEAEPVEEGAAIIDRHAALARQHKRVPKDAGQTSSRQKHGMPEDAAHRQETPQPVDYQQLIPATLPAKTGRGTLDVLNKINELLADQAPPDLPFGESESLAREQIVEGIGFMPGEHGVTLLSSPSTLRDGPMYFMVGMNSADENCLFYKATKRGDEWKIEQVSEQEASNERLYQ